MSHLALFSLFVLGALSQTINSGDLQFNCSCNLNNFVDFKWKGFQDEQYNSFSASLYLMKTSDASRLSRNDYISSSRGVSKLASAYIRQASGLRTESFSSSSIDRDTGVFCVLDRAGQIRGMYQVTGCVSTTPTKPSNQANIIIWPVVAVAFLLIFMAVLTMRLVQRLKKQKEEQQWGQPLDSVDGGGNIELQQMSTMDNSTSVQMFPAHPMMQTQQVYQDPLATLAPVYTATYVQPGVH